MARTREEILQERRRLREEYGDLFDATAALLFRHDPAHINFEVNKGEFTTVKNFYLRANRAVVGGDGPPCYCSFAYSALASFRMGMSGSASFQRAKKS
jgi:hypothetical protein